MTRFPYFTGPNDAGELRAYLNTLVNELNAQTYGSDVTVYQMKCALAALGGGQIYTVQNAISADIADAVNIEWTSGNVVTMGDPLAASIQSSLSYNDAQMTALFALARMF